MISISGVFSILYGILLLSRIYAIANVYSFPVDSSTIQVMYVGIIILLAFIKEKKLIIKKQITELGIAILILVGYLFLFGFVFVNPVMAQYTKGMVMRQGLFLAVVITTALFARRNHLLLEVITTSFWTVAIVLFVQFITHLEDLAKINLVTLFDISSRTRTNFGLGHYYFLGMLCSCEIILGAWLAKMGHKPKASFLVMALAVIMLLGSASRNAIFSLIVFALVEIYFHLDKYALKNVYKFLIKLVSGVLVLLMILFGDAGASVEGMLLLSNRLVLFSVALPTFFSSGRTWTGLGLASGEIYGQNLTPYKTYWLDNGYVYTLITTGYIGACIYLVLIILMLRKFWKMKKNSPLIGTLACSTFFVYLFTALFETTLFNGGALINYLFMPIFLILLGYNTTDDTLLIGGKKVGE